METKLFELSYLIHSMHSNNKSMEQFNVVYANVRFDIILCIDKIPYEILIGAINHNWSCILYMKKGYIVEMSDDDYYNLCNILNLNWNEDHFSSIIFLKYIAERSPSCISNNYPIPSTVARIRNNRDVDEADKIYFVGWNNHIQDHRKARNFDKTEEFLGLNIANYCRMHNISSMWSDNPIDENPPTFPKLD